MWHISEDTKIGPLHVRQGTINQDSFRSEQDEDGRAIFVVADGAGSLDDSRHGADFTVDTIVEKWKEYSVDEQSTSVSTMIDTIIRETRKELLSFDNARQMGCTVAVVAVEKDGTWCAATVGDAFAVVQIDESTMMYVSSEPHEYANITQLLTVAHEKNLVINSIEGDTLPLAVAVASDGMSNASVYKGQAHVSFWKTVFDRILRKEATVGDLLEFMEERQKIDDDTTMIVAVDDIAIVHSGSVVSEKTQGDNGDMSESENHEDIAA